MQAYLIESGARDDGMRVAQVFHELAEYNVKFELTANASTC